MTNTHPSRSARVLQQELQNTYDENRNLRLMLSAKEHEHEQIIATLISLTRALEEARRETTRITAENWALLGILQRPWKAVWACIRRRSTRAEIIANEEYLAMFRQQRKRRNAAQRKHERNQTRPKAQQFRLPQKTLDQAGETNRAQSPVHQHQAYFTRTPPRNSPPRQSASGRNVQESPAQSIPQPPAPQNGAERSTPNQKPPRPTVRMQTLQQ